MTADEAKKRLILLNMATTDSVTWACLARAVKELKPLKAAAQEARVKLSNAEKQLHDWEEIVRALS